MDDAGFLLQLAGDGDIARTQDDGAKALEGSWPDDDVGDRGLVLDGHEDDAACGARPLADGDEAGDGDALARAGPAQVLVANDAAPDEISAQEGGRVRAQREREKAVVVHDFFTERHGWKCDHGFRAIRILMRFSIRISIRLS